MVVTFDTVLEIGIEYLDWWGDSIPIECMLIICVCHCLQFDKKYFFLNIQVKGTCQYLGVVLLVFFCLQQMKEATDGAKLRRADTVKSTPVRFPTWKVKKS